MKHRILCKNEYIIFSYNLDFIEHWTHTLADE